MTEFTDALQVYVMAFKCDFISSSCTKKRKKLAKRWLTGHIIQPNMTYTGGKEIVSSHVITTASYAREHEFESQCVNSNRRSFKKTALENYNL